MFVVPVLMVFAYDMIWRSPNGCNGLSLTQQLDATGYALLHSPYFKAKGGRDHLIVSDSFKLSWMNMELKTSPSFSLVRIPPPKPAVCKPSGRQSARPQQRCECQSVFGLCFTHTSQHPLRCTTSVKCNPLQA